MRFGTAIERLVDNYEYAKSKIWIRDEVAWALYHTWKEADDRKDEPTISKMEQVGTMSCQECKHWDVYKGCRERVCKYEPKDEPQTCSVNGRPYDCGNCEYFKCTADEPQTEREGE